MDPRATSTERPPDDLRVLQAVYAALLAFNRLERAKERVVEQREELTPPYIVRHRGPRREGERVERETSVALRIAKRFLSRTALYGVWLAAGLTAAFGIVGCTSGRARTADAPPVDANRERLRQDLAFLSETPVAECPELPLSPPPAPVRTHSVKAGETLWRIASSYGIDVRELQRKNGVADPGSLKVGQVLVLPGAPGTSATPADRGPAPSSSAGSGASRAVTRSAPGVDAAFRWPIAGRVIADHGVEGMDIEADAGETVTAIRSGTVSFVSDRLQGYGKTVVLSHPDGYQSFYAYNSEILVQTGDVVRQGDAIAKAGTTGRAERPTLHFRLFREGTPVDAARVLR
ncbi:MAG: peptidoglycan DD-metalloendopeptidase family protein [Planctomycetes bacterium]|nr:peptidoglycan DD-metalloendopeptidase family protein [Planctomycetota bacterium]